MNKELLKRIEADEKWDSRELGADIKFARRAPEELERQVDEALDLKLISIRLPNSLIETFKLLASIEGVGYQPLIREVLLRHADAELKSLSREIALDHIKRVKELKNELSQVKKAA